MKIRLLFRMWSFLLVYPLICCSCKILPQSENTFHTDSIWVAWSDNGEIVTGPIDDDDLPRFVTAHSMYDPPNPSWLNALPNGSGHVVLVFSSGMVESITYKNGLKHGESFIKYFDTEYNRKLLLEGDTFEGSHSFQVVPYKEGLEHGRWIMWYPNWQINMEVELYSGLPNGRFIQWYSDGIKSWECSFVDGIKHGTERAWHPNGSIMMEAEYVDGELLWEMEWDVKGNILSGSSH